MREAAVRPTMITRHGASRGAWLFTTTPGSSRPGCEGGDEGVGRRTDAGQVHARPVVEPGLGQRDPRGVADLHEHRQADDRSRAHLAERDLVELGLLRRREAAVLRRPCGVAGREAELGPLGRQRERAERLLRRQPPAERHPVVVGAEHELEPPQRRGGLDHRQRELVGVVAHRLALADHGLPGGIDGPRRGAGNAQVPREGRGVLEVERERRVEQEVAAVERHRVVDPGARRIRLELVFHLDAHGDVPVGGGDGGGRGGRRDEHGERAGEKEVRRIWTRIVDGNRGRRQTVRRG